MQKIFISLAIGIGGVFLYSYIAIEVMGGELNRAIAAGILISAFVFNKK